MCILRRNMSILRRNVCIVGENVCIVVCRCSGLVYLSGDVGERREICGCGSCLAFVFEFARWGRKRLVRGVMVCTLLGVVLPNDVVRLLLRRGC